MRVVERPGRIKIHGKDLRVFDPETELARKSVVLRVQHTLEFALCDEPARRMLLAVAVLADEYGIAAGWDDETQIAQGISVGKLALMAGLPLLEAHMVLDTLCQPERPLLYRLEPKPPTRAPVWVLPEYEDDTVRGTA